VKDRFQRVVGLLSEKENEDLYLEIRQSPWRMQGFSQDPANIPDRKKSLISPDICMFWYLNLVPHRFVSVEMVRRIELATKQKYKVLQVYANGQTTGQDGSWHRDTGKGVNNPNLYTFLHYCNPVWENDWGGATVFQDCIAEYIPNTGILFNSNLVHAGLAPNAKFKGLRTTIAFKLEKI
jgi:hypothetical protein